MKRGTRLAGIDPQAEHSRRAGTIQNGSSTREAPAISSIYVIAKRNGLREKNTILLEGLRQQALLRIRQTGL